MDRAFYTAPITRATPTAFIILLDQSGSMSEPTLFDGIAQSKAEALATVTNALVDELVDRCRRVGGINDYYHIAILGYSGLGVRNLLCERGFVVPSELAARKVGQYSVVRERTLPDGRTVMTTTLNNRWVEPTATGSTPMFEALSTAWRMADEFCADERFRNSYPPTIFNITDGEATDAMDTQLLAIAEQLKALSTLDGGAMLVNINLSSATDARRIVFPTSEHELPDDHYARLLYRMSSELPARYTQHIMRLRPDVPHGPFRAMSFNAMISDVVAMLNIGTITSI